MTREAVTSEAVDRGRESYARREWAEAFAQLSAADQKSPLAVGDLERLGDAAFLIGKDMESIAAWTRAHQEYLRAEDYPHAARSAFELGFKHMNAGDFAQGFGWHARAARILEERQLDCVERGYLLVPAGLRAIGEGDYSAAHETFTRADEIGQRFHDAELLNMTHYGRGRALLGSGRIADGLALIDEVMVAITAGEVRPSTAGALYCNAIEAFKGIFDLRRAQEWTAALSRWCESQPDLVPFRGQCLVFRAELMQLHGEWPDAMEESIHACERLGDPPGHPAAGAAHYQRAELHRLFGDLAKAEEAYRQASQLGRQPQPGLALLRLVQGQADAAHAAMRRVMDETGDRATRATMLLAHVEVLLAVADIPAAHAAADELSQIAAEYQATLLDAMSAQAMGAVLLVEGDVRGALAKLRQAWAAWRELDAPYDSSRVRVMVGLACRALGDEDSAEMEFDAARSTFQQLGAASDLSRLERLSAAAAPNAVGGLTAREAQVLALIATGKTNRAIAADLVISEKTVARHVSNIFDKLGVSTRAAATAYAYEHKLV